MLVKISILQTYDKAILMVLIAFSFGERVNFIEKLGSKKKIHKAIIDNRYTNMESSKLSSCKSETIPPALCKPAKRAY